jgi:murein DD-endopeptidase MepM/ murein hydrolase activator NlpD
VAERLAVLMLGALLALPVAPAAAAPAATSDETGLAVDRAFPVRGETDYGRAHHDYPATDVFAACGRRVGSPVDGVVLEVSRRDRWDPATDRGADRGGKFVSIRGGDGVRYYLSHLAGVRADVGRGTRVRAGRHLGWVGRTGSARSTPCHVHFGLSPVCSGTGEWRIRRGVVRPFRFLRSWEQGGNRSPAAAVRAWEREHGCP